jgi:peptidoglycan/xylan/chitin deacetylase (PgdA/CDA1 family)
MDDKNSTTDDASNAGIGKFLLIPIVAIGGLFAFSATSGGKMEDFVEWIRSGFKKFGEFINGFMEKDNTAVANAETNNSNQSTTNNTADKNTIDKNVQSQAEVAAQPIKISQRIDLSNKIYLQDDNKKDVHLSFDDGIMGAGESGEKATSELLDVLKENNAKATFFITTDTIDNSEKRDLVKRMVREGHEVGVHSTNHDYELRNQSSDVIRADVKESKKFLEDLLQEEFPNYKVTLFRPPGGFIHERYQKILAEEGLAVAMWDVDTSDYDTKGWIGGNEVAEQIRSGRSNVLMHNADLPNNDPNFPISIERDKELRGDGAELNIAEKVKTFIPQLKSEGYSFQTISEGIRQEGIYEIAGGTFIGSEATHGLLNSGTKNDLYQQQNQNIRS